MMKKIVMFAFAVVLLMIAFASLGPIIGLAISVAIAYFSFKQFLKTDATLAKVFWGIIVLICISSILGNVPALAGIVAIVILYIGYKKWTEAETDEIIEEKNDPFTNFERQWEDLNKNHI